MSRFDSFRSMVREAARKVGDGAKRIAPLSELRRYARELAKQRILVPEQAVNAAIARTPGLEAATTQIRDGAIWVDASFDDGHLLRAGYRPERPSFAPRGAKEIVFSVEPMEQAQSGHAADVAGALGAVVAQALWAIAIPRAGGDLGAALVDRETGGRMRMDLRNVPAVRQIMAQGGAGPLLDVLELGEIRCEEGEMALQLRLPQLR